MTNINIFLAGIFFFGFSAYMLRYALKSFRQFKTSTSWPFVHGKITKSEATRGAGMGSTFWINYQYKVGEREYTGRRVALYTLQDYEFVHLAETFSGASDGVWEYVRNTEASKNAGPFPHAPYKIGDVVPVYYDPASPKDSVLIVGAPKEKPYSGIIIATFAMFMGLALMLFGALS